ncbi:MAG: ABC transporter ATP-binding protein [Candidatus Methanomethylophilaceae archaeon]|jgi:iron complex transport system ATP-binding protein
MEKAMELRNVSVVRDGRRILDSVNLDIDAGENVAVIGPNGSGKTTLIKLLRGEIYPYFDEENPASMKIFGENLWSVPEIKKRIGTVSMDLQSMFGEETLVGDVILSGFFGSLDVFRNHDVTDSMKAGALRAAEYMGVEHLMERTLHGLSLGEMRRVLIARALVFEPKMLVLDEPMTGLDIVMRSKFRRMFDIMAESGVSIAMITHDLSDIPVSVRRVIMIKDGKVYADGPKEEVLVSEKVSGLFGEPIKVKCANGIYTMELDE